MKTDRTKLYKKIENAIAKGVADGEEVDATAKSIMDTVWPIIDFLQVHGNTITEPFSLEEIKTMSKGIATSIDYHAENISSKDNPQELHEVCTLIQGIAMDNWMFTNE